MAKDGHKQLLGVMTPPPHARGGGDTPTLFDPRGDTAVPTSSQTGASAESGRYLSDSDAPTPAGPAVVDAPSVERSAVRSDLVRASSCLTAEISASAIRDNLALLRRLVGPDVTMCVAVKADCYGHGLDLLARVIGPRSDGLAVATASEAFRLRELGYDGPVLMLFPTGAGASGELLGELLAADVCLTVVSGGEVVSIARAARRYRLRADVHVKVDTGMRRGGACPCDVPSLVRRVRNIHRVELRGLYTHFACADEADKTSACEQMTRFRRVAHECRSKGLVLHAANSAATIDLPQTHLDMVRPGIAVYGYQSSESMLNLAALHPSLRLTGRLMQVKSVAAGDRCGYGLTYMFDRPGRIGLVPAGYGDGYLRSFSNRAHMRIAGRYVPVRGRVSMDQTIIDLTDVPQAAEGDEVEIISPNPSDPHSVESLARLAGTIPYEITCGLGNRVQRELVE